MTFPAIVGAGLVATVAALLTRADSSNKSDPDPRRFPEPQPRWLSPTSQVPPDQKLDSLTLPSPWRPVCFEAPRPDYFLYRMLQRWGLGPGDFDRGTPFIRGSRGDGWFDYPEVVQTALDLYHDAHTPELNKRRLEPFFTALAYFYYHQVPAKSRRVYQDPFEKSELSPRDLYYLSQAVALDPKHIMAHYLYGRAVGNKDVLLEAIRQAPDFYPLDLELSLQYFLEGSTETAMQILDNLETRRPTLAQPNSQKAYYLHERGRNEEAIREIWQALQKDPLHHGVKKLKEELLGSGQIKLSAEQLHLRGLWQELEGDPEGAYVYLQLASEKKPGDPKIFAALYRVSKPSY